MHPSQLEIQREVEALRDIRRRSTTQGGPGALILDPDLPNPSSPASASTGYWASGNTASSSNDDSSSSSHSSGSEERGSASDDPFHLFWVPARLHPEIAPAEFRAFLKEHARTPPPEGAVGRSDSLGPPSSGLGRKRSMLSRQYKPSENDGVEDEHVVPLRRNRSVFANTGPQLTINDLQKLEELAEEASQSDDPTKLRKILRRSLSLNVAPSVIDKMDDMPDMPDDADAPIIVPRPGQILRRAARTKIRKNSLPGDGGGHRFGASRRGMTIGPTESRTSSDISSSDHGDLTEPAVRPRAFSAGSISSDSHHASLIRPESYSEETAIYDAYVQEEPEDEPPQVESPLGASTPTPPIPPLPTFVTSAPPPRSSVPSPPSVAESIPEPMIITSTAPVLHHPQPHQPHRLAAAPTEPSPSRTPSPDASSMSHATSETAVASTSLSESSSSISKSPTPSPNLKKEKDKKGLFGKWSSDKGGKKIVKEKEREKEAPRPDKEKEKDTGFFTSLFGSKKKQDEQTASSPGFTGSGRETATALLGASKSSKTNAPSPSPSIPGIGGAYARYPIHVERAIYRLSHIKLANPRRPLYEQVLISNLMFWYLGVINKTQTSTTPPPGQGQAVGVTPPGSPPPVEKSQAEQEQREAEERQMLEREREQQLEREREWEREQQKKEASPRRGALTKPAPPTPGGRRTAEMPVRGPQYEMQHRVMEQEYGPGGGYGYGQPGPIPLGGGPPMRVPRQPSPPVHHAHGAPKLVQPQPQASGGYLHTGNPSVGYIDSPHLPPGAMPPIPIEQPPWAPSSSPPPSSPTSRTLSTQSNIPPPVVSPVTATSKDYARSQHRPKSPPPPQAHNRYSPAAASPPNRVPGGRTPSRSLSAVPSPSPPVPHDVKVRKNSSMHAVMPVANGRPRTAHGAYANGNANINEEEDVPLALYQQQRRK